jgi:hypothetical protein
MLAPGASITVQYALGGAVHLGIGLTYGLLYAWLLGPVRRRGRTVKGLLYGAALAGIALAVMPAASAMMGSGAGNPCNPCRREAAGNPCSARAAGNPCGGASNPCKAATGNPGAGVGNPCAGGAGNPCGGAGNPCGGGGSPLAGLLSLLNHAAYALALAFTYGRWS